MNTTAATIAAVAVLSLATAGRARADEGVVSATAPTHTVDASYRSQLVLVDLASVATAVGGAKDDQVFTIGVAGLALGAPIVHLAHGNPGRALASAALRSGLTVGGAYVASAACTPSDDHDDWHCLGDAMLGGMVGLGAAIIIDDVFLGKQTREVRTGAWSPQVAVGHGAVQLGLSGSF